MAAAIDPLAGNGEEATLIAASLLGPDVKLAGGAAGDDLAMKAAEVALGRRAEGDAIVLAMIFSRWRSASARRTATCPSRRRCA